MPPAMMRSGLWEVLIRPSPGRLGFVLRLAMVCALITLVIEIFQLPSLATTVYIAFFVYHPHRGATVMASVAITVFITFALLVALAITAGVLDHPFWRVCAMAVFSFVVLFVGSASKLKPLAPTLAMIVGYVLDLIGGLQVGEIAVRGLLYTWLVIAIPAGISIVFSLLVGPSPRRLLETALADRLNASAKVLRGGDVAAIDVLLRRGDAEMSALLKSARREHNLRDGADAALARAIDSTMAILSYVSLLAAKPFDPATEAQLADILEEMADILRKDGYPVGIIVAPIADERLTPDSARLLDLLRAELVGFAEGPVVVTKKASGEFLRPDALTDPTHIRHALKTTGAAMACYLIFQQLNWSGIHTCLITCYVVSLGSAGETIEKLTLRICGCLLGAALGLGTLLFVIPHIDGIVALALVIAVGTIPGAWVSAGGPRISYAGLQIAFAFYLTVLQGPAPAFDLSLGRDRIIGILFGNLMIYLVFTRVWPVSIGEQIDPAIAGLLKALASLASAGREGARRQVGAARNAVAAIRQQLRVARYEPVSVRPAEAWFEARESALAEIDALQAPLLVDAASADASMLARRLADLEALVSGFGGQGAIHAKG